MRKTLLTAIITAFLGCSTNKNHTNQYLGMVEPTDSAKVFAPGVISTGMKERDISISANGNEIFFCRDVGVLWNATIMHTKQNSFGKWSNPEVLPFCTNPQYHYIEPFISADSKRLYFVSNMPTSSSHALNDNIWYVERDKEKWSAPKLMDSPINSSFNEYYPTFTKDGTIYFTSIDTSTNSECIFRARLINGKYLKREILPDNVNIGTERFNAFIAYDESYIIVPAGGMPNSFGGIDYYISFRNDSDCWSKPQNLGKKINSNSYHEYSASVSPDGKYLFFMSARSNTSNLKRLSTKSLKEYHNSPQNGNTDIYWISTVTIDSLRLRAEF